MFNTSGFFSASFSAVAISPHQEETTECSFCLLLFPCQHREGDQSETPGGVGSPRVCALDAACVSVCERVNTGRAEEAWDRCFQKATMVGRTRSLQISCITGKHLLFIRTGSRCHRRARPSVRGPYSGFVSPKFRRSLEQW